MKNEFTKEEWNDLCYICNPNNTMESINALRDHDKKIITEIIEDLKKRRDSWDYCGLIKIYTGTIIEDYNKLIKKWEMRLK